jgi:two-component system cell cycle response regulator CpdR
MESSFDLLLSDIRMPVMDGIALATQSAELAPSMPILLMTGFAEQRERAEPLMRIVVDVVQKPFSLPQIRQAVADALTRTSRLTGFRFHFKIQKPLKIALFEFR